MAQITARVRNAKLDVTLDAYILQRTGGNPYQATIPQPGWVFDPAFPEVTSAPMIPNPVTKQQTVEAYFEMDLNNAFNSVDRAAKIKVFADAIVPENVIG